MVEPNNELTKKIIVLYVEDEPLLREEVSAFIKRRVKKLYTASNGLEALEILDHYPVDVVITDLMMPKMDGIKLTEHIRSKDQKLPIFITTAINDVSVMQSTIALGIDRYLIKPLDTAVLVEALEAVYQKMSGVSKQTEPVKESMWREQLNKTESELAKLYKQVSGKGPDKVSVFLQANLLEVVIKGSRTKLEQTILQSEDNVRIIDFLRETYYRQLKDEMKAILKSELGLHGQLQQIVCYSREDVDHIKWIVD